MTIDAAANPLATVNFVIPNTPVGRVRNLLFSWHPMPHERLYYVYIVASKSRVLYVGMTGFLMNRVLRHGSGEGGAFTRKYRVNRLVYYECFHQVGNAIARETEMKKWRREKKIALIEKQNPTWEDLAETWGGPALMTISAPPAADSSPPLRTGSE